MRPNHKEEGIQVHIFKERVLGGDKYLQWMFVMLKGRGRKEANRNKQVREEW